MGENYLAGDEEDLFVKNAGKIYLLQGRYRIEVPEAVAGNLVIIEGIDQAITKTATITHADSLNTDIMVPLKFWSQPTIKVAIEPLVPSELPKMLEAIRRANKSYLLLKTKVEESGEHILTGNGELHLDCILHDIRLVYSDI
jgi:116 kDa U5 small nuclear ribonucleoprotein component